LYKTNKKESANKFHDHRIRLWFKKFVPEGLTQMCQNSLKTTGKHFEGILKFEQNVATKTLRHKEMQI
jgi:hypothetical protein